MSRLLNSTLILALFLFVGCSSSKTVTDSASDMADEKKKEEIEKMADAKMADAPASMAHGTWTWSVESPDGTFTGTFFIEGTADAPTGYMLSDEDPTGTKLPISDIVINGDELSYSFENPDYGKMNVKGVIDGDTYNSMLEVTQFGVEMPMESMRKKDM